MKCQILLSGENIGENLHEMSNPVFWGKIRKKIQYAVS